MEKGKNAWKKLCLFNTYLEPGLFFSFSVTKCLKIKIKKAKKGTKVGCTFSGDVLARWHLHWPKLFKTAWETKLHIFWRFGEVRTSIGHIMDTQKTNRQTNRWTERWANWQMSNLFRLILQPFKYFFSSKNTSSFVFQLAIFYIIWLRTMIFSIQVTKHIGFWGEILKYTKYIQTFTQIAHQRNTGN